MQADSWAGRRRVRSWLERRAKQVRRIARVLSRPRPGSISGFGRIQRLIFIIDVALDVRRERQRLWSLDDRALKDIGSSRSDAYAEAHRPIWDLPGDRLRP